MSEYIGVDIGGTNIKIGVVSHGFEVKEYIKFKTNKSNIDTMLSEICDVINILKKRYDIECVGIGSPGKIPDNRIVLEAGNIPYNNTPVADIVEQNTKLPVYLDNDANCALYGEKIAGAGRDVNDMIVITIGTGVGGGIMINRKAYHGYNNRAGELGHFIIDINGKPCSCGLHGCFEQYGSVTAFTAYARSEALKDPDSVLYKMAQGNPENIGGRLPFKAMYRGCMLSKRIIDKYIYDLACGINSLSKIFQPDIFVLTGGIMNEGAIITDLLKDKLLPEVNCTLSPLDGKAGLIGAALIKVERESY